jgi:uncharacterized C2H2 Zn-finger protein
VKWGPGRNEPDPAGKHECPKCGLRFARRADRARHDVDAHLRDERAEMKAEHKAKRDELTAEMGEMLRSAAKEVRRRRRGR